MPDASFKSREEAEAALRDSQKIIDDNRGVYFKAFVDVQAACLAYSEKFGEHPPVYWSRHLDDPRMADVVRAFRAVESAEAVRDEATEVLLAAEKYLSGTSAE